MRRVARHLPLAGLFAFFVFTEFRGIDFGLHWDEVDWQIRPVQDMVTTGLFMPRAAIYPAFSKWLILLPALVSGLEKALAVGFRPNLIQSAMLETVSRPEYLLTARRLFVVVSGLSLVWVYCAALTLRLRVWEAFLAAATLGLSWEFAYHSRWVATDCITVQFCALTLWLLLLYLRGARREVLYAAAVATGCAIGTKFPVAPLLVAVLGVGASKIAPYRLRAQISRAFALSLTAVLAFLVTTPAALLEPFKFVELAQYISTRYYHGHYGYTVGLGWDHVWHVLLYFGLWFFSPYHTFSLVLSAGVIAGMAVWWRRDRRVALLLIGFPIAFLFFFCFHYAAIQVRNYLLLAPCFALLLAGAVGALVDWLPHFALRALLATGLVAGALANAAFLVGAAESIRHHSAQDDVAQALAYAASQPNSSFRLSNEVKNIARSAHVSLPPNTRGAHPDHVIFFVPAEGPSGYDWPGTDPLAFERIFGPGEVNLNLYPTWFGEPHVGVMTVAQAHRIGLPWLR